ncbi:glycosyltransferase family 2 protein [Candidatus Saganbacteria bacterium]|nr:glycosyltransferase family 2 protein [Candidatus Saganbacteria bacterium]
MEISVVMPCLNEEKTIGECIDKAMVALNRLGVPSEIVISDNGSTDRSAQIALKKGARVVRSEQKGYGSAYLTGFENAKGNIMIMGDSDNTYDFTQIGQLIAPLKNGYDFVIGSRLRGNIKKGAMPWLHRYFGTPLLSWMLNLVAGTKISDVNCGMRAFTKEAYKKMHLRAAGMEFASEMVINAARAKLKFAEVPISYDRREGESKLRTFSDGWRHLRFMLIYSPNYLFLGPGLFIFILGLALLLSLLQGPINILGYSFDYHFSILGAMLAILGYQIISLGMYAKIYALSEQFEENDLMLASFLRFFNLEKGLAIGAIVLLIGLGMNFYLVYEWLSGRLIQEVRFALVALTFTVIGVQTIFSSFFFSILGIKKK